MELLDQINDLSMSHKSGDTDTQAAGRVKSSNGFDGPDRASARRPRSLYLTANKLRHKSPENISSDLPGRNP